MLLIHQQQLSAGPPPLYIRPGRGCMAQFGLWYLSYMASWHDNPRHRVRCMCLVTVMGGIIGLPPSAPHGAAWGRAAAGRHDGHCGVAPIVLMQTSPGASTALSLYLRANVFSKHSIRHAVLTSPAYGVVHHGTTITSHHLSPPTRQRQARE